MKKEAGFTLVEIVVVIALLGVFLSIIYNVMVQNAFIQKRIKDEMEVQNSAKAFLNVIGEIVFMCVPPVVYRVNGSEIYEFDTPIDISNIVFNDGSYIEKREDKFYLCFGEDYSEKEYNYITNLEVVIKEKGIELTVTGAKDKVSLEFSSSFYTRNT